MRKFSNISLAIMILAGVLVVGAKAQTSSAQKVIANVPFTFSVGKATLPAGRYTITVVNPSSDRKILQIRSMDGRSTAMVLTTANSVSATIRARTSPERFVSCVVVASRRPDGDHSSPFWSP